MMPHIFVNGQKIELSQAEYEEMFPPVPKKDRLLQEAAKNITTAPTLGFGGPSGKEVFNGNR